MADNKQPEVEANDTLLYEILYVLWKFLENRGAVKSQFAKSEQLFITLPFNNSSEEVTEIRMLRTGDPRRSSYELEEGDFLFEIDQGSVSCEKYPPARARKECILLALAIITAPAPKVHESTQR